MEKPLTALKLTILAEIKKAERNKSPGLCDDELAALLQVPGRPVRAATTDLRNSGYLKEAKAKEQRRVGVKPVRIWLLTDAGRGVLERCKAA